MRRADYIHSLDKYKNKVDVIVIEDLNLGSVSVTNDIENVIEDICRLEKVDKEQFMIVYKDSEGSWDGFDTAANQFVGLGMDKWYEAIELWLSRKTEL